MQYILTSDEYKTLLREDDYRLRNRLSEEEMQELCTRIANEMPVPLRWAPQEPPRVWGCILTKKEAGGHGYCDCCPVTKICPHPNKRWSK